jgi:hypothetical protein
MMEDFQTQELPSLSSNASETNKRLPITYRTKGITSMGVPFFMNNTSSSTFNWKDNMGFFTRKSKKDKLNEQYKKKLEQAYKMSTSNRSESDRLTAEANDILEEIKKLEASES